MTTVSLQGAFVEKLHLTSVEELNMLLLDNCSFANGKNIRIDHLYDTAATSRWEYENIFGIYLARPVFAWMALWIGLTSREKLRKRHIRYIRPDVVHGDAIGHIEVFSDEPDLHRLIARETFLYLFDFSIFSDMSMTDVGQMCRDEKVSHLLSSGFTRGNVERRGQMRKAILPPTSDPSIVIVDEWQMAVVNCGMLVPNVEITFGRNMVDALAKRIVRTSVEVGEDYIV